MPSRIGHHCNISKDLGVMILLLGQTGVGKSTFINKVAGRDVAEVGHDLGSCTSNVEHFTIKHPSHENPTRSVVFVDTPGFNSGLDDETVFKRILDWLQTSCDPDVEFGGILYLQDIAACRDITGTSVVTATKLDRPKIAPNVLFATINWKEPETPQQQRHEQLMITNWRGMIDKGSQVARFNSTISPWSIVDNLLGSTVELDVIRQELNTAFEQFTKESADAKRKRGGRKIFKFSSLFNFSY